MSNNKLKLDQFVKKYPIDNINKKSAILISPKHTTGISRKQFAPPEYQRYSVWGEEQKKLYIQSTIEGMAYNPIIVVDVRKCLSYSKSIGDKFSVQKFQSYINNGIEWLSVDGLQRTTTVCDFVNCMFSLEGKYTTRDGHEINFGSGSDFCSLAKDERLYLMNSDVYLNTVEEATFDDIKEIFKRLNSGTALSPQEKRNAETTPLADWSRSIAKKYDSISSRVCKNISRMEDRRLFTRVAHMLEYPKLDSTEQEYDSYYVLGNKTLDLSEKYDADLLNSRIPEILDVVKNSFPSNMESFNIKYFIMMVMEVDSVHQSGKVITDPRRFRLEIQRKIDELSIASRKRFDADYATWETTLNPDPAKKPKVSNYFHNKLSHLNNSGPRESAFKHFHGKFASEYIAAHLVKVAK